MIIRAAPGCGRNFENLLQIKFKSESVIMRESIRTTWKQMLTPGSYQQKNDIRICNLQF